MENLGWKGRGRRDYIQEWVPRSSVPVGMCVCASMSLFTVVMHCVTSNSNCVLVPVC